MKGSGGGWGRPDMSGVANSKINKAMCDGETINIFSTSLRHFNPCKRVKEINKIERDAYILKGHSTLLMDYNPIQGE